MNGGKRYKKGKAKGLTIKQKRFADEYIISGNATEAAKKAGYSEKTASLQGSENIRKPYIKEYIQQTMETVDNGRILQRDDILKLLTQIATGQNQPSGMPSVDNQLTAMDKLSKIHGIYLDKTQIDINGSIPIVIKDDFDD